MSAPSARYVVIGQPVDHSRSPEIHARFAAAAGQSIDYRRLSAPRDDFAGTARAFFDGGGHGANVTLPFKAEAADFADTLTPRARAAGAVNTLTRADDGRIGGDNTDGVGLVRDLQQRLGARLADADVLILGAGGAVRGAIPAVLAERPANLTVANRTRARAEAIAAAHGSGIAATTPDKLDRGFDIVINAVSAGLSGETPTAPDVVIGPETAAYDMLYADTSTPFCDWARTRGAPRVCDGFGMLVEQAAESFYVWRGVHPDTAPVIAALAPTAAA